MQRGVNIYWEVPETIISKQFLVTPIVESKPNDNTVASLQTSYDKAIGDYIALPAEHVDLNMLVKEAKVLYRFDQGWAKGTVL